MTADRDLTASYQFVCSMDDLWEGEMEAFEVGGREILLVHAEGGIVRAFGPTCPHQDSPLVEGDLEGTTLTCAAHLWCFDVETGAGINPKAARLRRYPVQVREDKFYVDVEDRSGDE